MNFRQFSSPPSAEDVIEIEFLMKSHFAEFRDILKQYPLTLFECWKYILEVTRFNFAIEVSRDCWFLYPMSVNKTIFYLEYLELFASITRLGGVSPRLSID